MTWRTSTITINYLRLRTMQQIRIARRPGVPLIDGQRFGSDWMEACQMNRWLLRNRLAEALAAHGPDSHWIETRTLKRTAQLLAA